MGLCESKSLCCVKDILPDKMNIKSFYEDGKPKIQLEFENFTDKNKALKRLKSLKSSKPSRRRNS